MSTTLRPSRSLAFAATLTLATVLVAAPAFAQSAQTVRLRGQIETLEGGVLKMKTRAGEAVAVKLAPNYGVTELRKAELSEIKDGLYIGVTAMPQKDGTLRAIAIHIFPQAMKGTAEGHGPWDVAPETTMTNATVDGEVTKGASTTLKVKYKDGEKTVVVVPETKIVAMEPGKPEMLKPGAHILIFGATKAADGSLSASRVVVGRDGLVPPM